MHLKEEIPIREEEVQCLLIKETSTKGGREVITMMCKEITSPKDNREIMCLHQARVILVLVSILRRVDLMGKAGILVMEQEHLMVKDRAMDLIQALPKVKDFQKVTKETCKENNETTLLVDRHGMTK